MIPTSAILKLKLNFATEEAHTILVDGIKRICDSIAVANRIPAERRPEYRHKGYTLPVVNDEEFIADLHNILGTASHSLFDETMALPFTPHEPNYIDELRGSEVSELWIFCQGEAEGFQRFIEIREVFIVLFTCIVLHISEHVTLNLFYSTYS